VARAYADSIGSLPFANPQQGCQGYTTTTIWGGGRGINGCGGAIAMGVGPTQAAASANLWTSFNEIKDDAFDVKGTGYWATYFVCNYDCKKWTFEQ
jgi:hypothetical protein